MSSRDWNTIGAGDRSPGWMRWAILPPLIPLAALVCLQFGPHPARRLYGFLIFGAGLAGLIVGIMRAIWYGSRPSDIPASMVKTALAVAWLMSLVFTAVGLSEALSVPPWAIAGAIPIAAVAVLVYIARQSQADDAADGTPDPCWSMGGVYYNPKDPALLVRARVGYGYTVNMANPRAYRFLVGFFGGIAVLVGFLLWSLR